MVSFGKQLDQEGSQMLNMPERKPHIFTLQDKRELAYGRYGINTIKSKGPPIFYFHGTPGSRIEGELLHSNAIKLGIHLIAIERPGFGYSSFQENRTLLDWPKDVVALADHLKIEKFGILGVSGGGPYVLACLKTLPSDRLVASTIVAGMYPADFGYTGMLFKNKLIFWISAWSTKLIEMILDWTMGNAARDVHDLTKLEKLAQMEMKSLDRPKVDRECFAEMMADSNIRESFIESTRQSLRTSSHGAAWELGMYGRDWRFKLDELNAKTLVVWHGVLDVNVPIAMADKASNLLKDVTYKRVETEAHLSLSFRYMEDILSDIASRINIL